MSTVELAASASKPRVRWRHRVVIVMGLLTALIGGVLGNVGTASAQPPSGACPATCPAPPPPPGPSQQEWQAAYTAANWWSNHHINWNRQIHYTPSRPYYPLQYLSHQGWPGQTTGGWYAYWEQTPQNYWYIYYGGTYNDYGGQITREERAHGAAQWQAFQTNRRSRVVSPYVEYDIDGYARPNSSRNDRRLVRNPMTGSVYATFDHYATFHYLGQF